MLHEFVAALHEADALTQADVPAHMKCQIRSALFGTWFTLRRQTAALTATSQGTRPGDPLADLLFGFLSARFSRMVVESYMYVYGLCAFLPPP